MNKGVEEGIAIAVLQKCPILMFVTEPCLSFGVVARGN